MSSLVICAKFGQNCLDYWFGIGNLKIGNDVFFVFTVVFITENSNSKKL